MELRTATAADLDEIAALLLANSPERGGSLTGSFSRDQVARMLGSALHTVVASGAGGVAGVLFAMPKDLPAAPPAIRAMLEVWPGDAGAYVYGPACIAASARGQGLLPRLNAELGTRLAGREAILFIRRDNEASMKAHLRLGMREVAGFDLEGVDYAVLSSGR